MDDDDLRYYARRAAEEQAAATQARNPAAAHAHQTLSDRFLDLVEGRLQLPSDFRAVGSGR